MLGCILLNGFGLDKIMPMNLDTYARAFVIVVFAITEAHIPGGIIPHLFGLALFLFAIGYSLFNAPLLGQSNRKIVEHE